MAAPKQFEPEVRQYFNALVNIAKYPTSPLIRQSIDSGHYGTFNLEQAQKQLLSLRSSYPQLGLGLHLTEGYNPDTFLSLINQFREIRTANNQLLVDLVKEAVDRNDPSLLQHYPATLPTEKTPETAPQVPPPVDQPPPPRQIPGAEPSKNTEANPVKTAVQQQQQQLQHAQQPEPPERPEGEQAENEQPEHRGDNQPEQNQQNQRQQRANRQQQPQPSNEPTREAEENQPRGRRARRRLARANRGRIAPSLRPGSTPTGSGGLLDALNNYWGAKDLVNASKWLADKMGLKGLGNALGRLGNWLDAPGRLLGSLGRSALNLGAQGLRTVVQGALNSLPALATGLAGIAATVGGWLMGAKLALAVIAASPALLFGALFALVSAMLIIAMYFAGLADQASNTECGKPGMVNIFKTVANPQDSYSVGEEIIYQIVVVYNIRCVKATADMVVTDTLPPNTTYVSASSTRNNYGFGTPVTELPAERIGDTVVWKLNKMQPEREAVLTLTVTPDEPANNSWLVNEATVTYTYYSPGSSSTPLNLTGPSRGLLCEPNLDERLLRIMEEAGVAANVSPSMIYSIAKAENGGHVPVYSLDGKEHDVSHCGAHGLMQIQHINDGSGKNYAASCAARGDSPNPPETWDGLAAKYNEISGGNLVDPDSDKDSIFGAAFYIKDRGWPSAKNYMEELTDLEAASIARQYLGGGGYAAQAVNSYRDAFSKQGTCGGGVTTQPIPGGVNTP